MFLSRRYRPNKWPFYVVLCLEFPLTVALLALFGIASPDEYRTKLWQDGANNGFNSSPLTGLYAAANYRPYTTPRVWSQFITDYNVVISVLSMFLMLTKSIMYILHVFPPVLSVLIHTLLIALYSVSVAYQASSDMTDPRHPQKGAPWYITKSCSVTYDKSNVGYCQQAKAAFACTCAMLGVFVTYFGFALWSCFPSKAQQAEYQRTRSGRQPRPDSLRPMKSATYPIPDTPGFQGGSNPMTPRTTAFNRLGGTTDLPLRTHFSSPNAPTSPTSFASRASKLPPQRLTVKTSDEQSGSAPSMYFPPPPRVSSR